MPKYLLQASYTLDGVRGVLSKGGSARKAAAQAAAESVGGTLESFYFAFGSTDAFALADLPDNAAQGAPTPWFSGVVSGSFGGVDTDVPGGAITLHHSGDTSSFNSFKSSSASMLLPSMLRCFT